MEIRKATVCDVDIISSFENEYFSHPYSKELIYKTLANPSYLILLAFEENITLGYAEFGYFVDSISIDRVVIDSKYRRNGYAEALISKGEEWAVNQNCEMMTLEVRSKNQSAVSLYEKLGYRLFSKRRGYYKNPDDDALIYIKGIKKEI